MIIYAYRSEISICINIQSLSLSFSLFLSLSLSRSQQRSKKLRRSSSSARRVLVGNLLHEPEIFPRYEGRRGLERAERLQLSSLSSTFVRCGDG